MESQDHKKPVASAGHEVHLCHRCAWPFPNSHPSARHRRSHKRVCGTIEGYTISQQDLAISDDENGSDDDEHIPSPNIEKKHAKVPGSAGKAVEMTNKSEDDVFSDAVTDFSESGISPGVEECIEIIKGEDKKIEQTSVQADANVIQLKKEDESAETTEPPKDPTSTGQIAIDQSLSGTPINKAGVKAVSVQNTADVRVEGDKLGSQILGYEEGKTSDPVVMAVDRNDELLDQLDGNAHNLVDANLNTVKDEPKLEGVKAVLSGKYDTSVPLSKSGEDIESSVLNDHIVTSADLTYGISVVSPDNAKVAGKNDLSGSENANGNEAEKGLVIVNENTNQECKETVPDADLRNMVEPENDQTTRLLKANVNSDKKVESEPLVAGKESSKEPALEAQVIIDSKQSVNSIDLLSSGYKDDDTKRLECSSKNDSSSVEDRDNDSLRSHKESEGGKVVDLLHSFGSINVDSTVTESNLKGNAESSENIPDQKTSKVAANLLTKPDDASEMVIEPEHSRSAVVLPEIHGIPSLKVQEITPVNEKCLNETEPEKRKATQNFCSSELVTTVSGKEPTNDDNAAISNKRSAEPIVLVGHIPSVLDSKLLYENSANDDDTKIYNGDDSECVGSKSSQDKGDDRLMKERDNISAVDVSCGSSSIAESLEGKWGSISVVETNSQSSPKSEINTQNSSKTTGEGHHSKFDEFEPPSFMTLVKSEGEADKEADPAVSEKEKDQHSKSASLQAGWFPSLTHVVNESPGRKKNEEIIAKVTNWSIGKEPHNQLKDLMNEAKSPKQVPAAANQTDETSKKDTMMNSVRDSEAPKDEISNKEDWNSPARYPAVIKKEKKKGKPSWVPFYCCSSVNRDL